MSTMMFTDGCASCCDRILALKVSGSLWPSVYDVFHLHDVMGSDHCPLGLTVRLDEGKGE